MSIIHPYPTLHEDTLDYRDPNSYDPDLRRVGKTEIVIKHRLARGNLVADLIEKQQASFFCTVVVGGTIFRRSELATIQKKGGGNLGPLTCEQRLTLPAFKKSGYVFARPGVVITKATDIQMSNATSIGISDFHQHDGVIKFPAHAIIAFTRWRRFFSMGSLFSLHSSELQKPGVFDVSISYDRVMKIRVTVAPKIFDEVQSNHEGTTRAHILCASLTQALKELHGFHRSNEGNEEELEVADGLKNFLKSKQLPIWEDDEFDPAYVASQLYPAALPADIED